MIPLPTPPKIIKKEGNEATFQIEGLYPGYGVTLGNTLRRVLISSLPGAAITQVKIRGVHHEFTTIPGVLEDVVTILLNLKQLRFKMFGTDPQRATLKVEGEKTVKGSDFELPAQVELINKDAHICTLTDKKANLEMEILIEKGLGYEPVERRKRGKLEIGTLALDAIFTPVRKVSYRIEDMRVGERTDFNRLILNLETDGTITPEEALVEASEILISQFSLFRETFKFFIEQKKAIREDLTKIEIENLGLSSRTLNILLKNNIKTVGGILRKNEKSLLGLKGMGKKGIKEIKKSLKKLGLELK